VTPSVFTLQQGSVIRGSLLTEINSDLPGQVVAMTTVDVRDSVRFQDVLIPRGSRIVGSYESTRLGQSRLGVSWFRFIFPDGRSVELADPMPSVDVAGRAGLHDRVNHHTGRLVGKALLFSGIAGVLQAVQPSQRGVRLSDGELAVEDAAREVEQVAGEILRRDSARTPTIKIRAGTGFRIQVNGDVTFEEATAEGTG